MMLLDNNLEKKLINVSNKAALSSSYFVGKKDKNAADKAAVDSMRLELNKIDIKVKSYLVRRIRWSTNVIHRWKAWINEWSELDIAVDPLEGTNFAANNLPGALSVIAIANKNNLFRAPETYMDKISANKENGIIDLDYTIKKI